MNKAVRTAALTCTAALCLVGQATAQPAPAPSSTSAQLAAPPPPAAQAPEHQTPRSEETALALSVVGSLAAWSVVLVGAASENAPLATVGAVGTFVAPSFGHWYGGKPVTRGMGLRALGGAVAFLGLAHAISCLEERCSDARGALNVGVLGIIGGGLLYVGGTVDDVMTAPGTVRKYNRRFEVLGLAPVVTQQSAGLALGGRF